MKETYTGRKAIRRDGQDHFAEVTVRASPGEAPSQVTLSAEAIEDLKSAFGEDFEYHGHNVWTAVMLQMNIANVAGEMPYVGATTFHAEVLRVRVSGNAGREVSGFLLTVAGMDAIGECLCAWEDERHGLMS
ncbi:hypothetical protein [Paludisphaera rhizosphaerae]|uniref:hypothetical protein n=1 Tax=Paludisphaera rhizosphaerae TaxID=2711216 RepID=UPI0013EA9314|nr:hypothetical protein [Paludisphaera rhizosphaerae]